MKICPKCGSRYNDDVIYCGQCGTQLEHVCTPPGCQYNQYRPYDPNNAFDASGPQGKCRGIAGLLAIILGSFGVHYFYLDKIEGGLLCILLSFVTCGIWSFITLVQGILMLCMNNAEFQRKYVESPSKFPLF